MIGRFVSCGSLIASLVVLAACDAPPSPSPEPIDGATAAIVHGTLAPSAVSGTREVALVWLYWPKEDCVSDPGDGVQDFGGESCTGSWFATRATLADGVSGFEIIQAEAPPAFVHGYDTDVAEALIAELPAGATDVSVDDLVGVSADHLVVYVPSPLDATRIEAQELGGAALGPGFHLVRALSSGPQVEGDTASGDRAYTRQAGVVVADEPVVIEPITIGEDGYRTPDAPALFL
ncbi:MAG: hypothetical protein U0414_41790 [Polyangiaceae bacterium]